MVEISRASTSVVTILELLPQTTGSSTSGSTATRSIADIASVATALDNTPVIPDGNRGTESQVVLLNSIIADMFRPTTQIPHVSTGTHDAPNGLSPTKPSTSTSSVKGPAPAATQDPDAVPRNPMKWQLALGIAVAVTAGVAVIVIIVGFMYTRRTRKPAPTIELAFFENFQSMKHHDSGLVIGARPGFPDAIPRHAAWRKRL